ncbi:MAG TPA: hypothetical protein VKU89_01210 [Solirubrobacteraceae bacterium]|nr:hypothetical protein [Solirubrobacteraceae bacterium]
MSSNRTNRNRLRKRAAGSPVRSRGGGVNRPLAGGAKPESGHLPRLTYRTARVLSAIAEQPGAPNRRIASLAEISDEGQTSKLLQRLERAELIYRRGERQMGGANAWFLTARGVEVERAGARELDRLPRRVVRKGAARRTP